MAKLNASLLKQWLNGMLVCYKKKSNRMFAKAMAKYNVSLINRRLNRMIVC